MMSEALEETLITFKAPPCSGCTGATDCADNKKACHFYYQHVHNTKTPAHPVRAKTIYNAINAPEGNRDLRAFFASIMAAKKDGNVAIFYRFKTKRLTTARRGSKNYSAWLRNGKTGFVGFFGRRFTEQEIADHTEKAIEKWHK